MTTTEERRIPREDAIAATVRQVVSGRVLVEFAHPVRHPSIAGECMRWYWSDPRDLEVGG